MSHASETATGISPPRDGADGSAGVRAGLERWGGRRRAIELGILAILVGAAVVAMPGLDDLRARLAGADAALIALAAGLELGSCLAFVVAFRGVFSHRLSWRFSYEVGMAEQAANVLLPTGGAGGLALGAWALRRIGMPADLIGRRTVAFFLVTSSANFLAVIVAGLGLATGLLPGEVALAAAAVPAVGALAVLGGVALLPRLATQRASGDTGRLSRLIASGREHLASGVRDAGRLLSSGHPLVMAGAVGYMGLDVLALAATFAAFGGGAPALGVFVLAYAVGQLGGLVPLPGGIGGTDGGLVLAFVAFGTPLGLAAAAVIAYRVFQLGVPALLGIAAFAQLRRSMDRGERNPCGSAAATPAGAPCGQLEAA